GLDGTELPRPGDDGRIPKDRYSRHVWRNLLEKFEPFNAHAVFEQNETGRIAARPRQTIHEASADRIDSYHEHYGHGWGYCCQRRPSRGGRGQDDIRRERDEFGREFALKRRIACGPANVNPHVLTVGQTQFL